MDRSPNLDLPYIMPAQAQKHVTHNEAVRRLDAIIQMALVSRVVSAPPAADNGARYVVPANATGAWAGQDGAIAAFQDGAWAFVAPAAGWIGWIADENILVIHDGTDFVPAASAILPAGALLQHLGGVGVNASADANNRLTVASAASLFTHTGAGHRAAINKAAATDTASLLFQTGYSGHAEIGLAGDNDLTVKTSADGVGWAAALRFASATGKAEFPNNGFPEHLLLNLLEDGGRFAGSPEPTSLAASTFTTPGYLAVYNGAGFSQGGKFVNNNASFGGAGAALDSQAFDLISRLKTATNARRYGPEFFLMKVTAGTGTLTPSASGGVTRYPPFTTRASSLATRHTRGLLVRVLSGSVAAPVNAQQYTLYRDDIRQEADLVLDAAAGWRQVTFVDERSAGDFADYDTMLFRLYCEPGSEFLVALPFLVPATCPPRPGQLFGRLPSVAAWR